ncbi:hypothetical protein FQP90_15460 [Paenarthrobacter nitroguajacolicus]|uniref:Uncharacterized protein n=1 Tax=Paenarthrobacter nitroguajacolicus TaxID=211146 RepID=A0A558GVS7_PAENT|nr:hypothetical protein [Paenarthrobacter nitroguajacolicus]TVU60946.1 hypothetical protein FQP90_15460 [Paenarthrobacter nitroguajacolicus]
MTPAMIAEREIRLSFSKADEIHDGLDRAVDALIENAAAADANCGILVTRHEPGTYTVALDESVPFGQTHEVLAA